MVLDKLTVVGTAGGKENIGGSVDLITAEDLAQQSHSDILRILRAVPGVNIQEEEGYGLRPNIGLRGSGTDRNSRVMIIEDGIPVAPAAYASPSAYYFPAAARMQAVEVTKGPSVIQYGPRTTGGAIHLISTAIPKQSRAFAEVLTGEYGRQRLHAHLGTRTEIGHGVDIGVLLETFEDEADGFLRRDTENSNTGFDISDQVIKVGLYGAKAPMPWSIELKLQGKTESSNQTYLGLTASDFEADPLRLYDAAQRDRMANSNELYQLTATIDLTAETSLTLIGYANDVSRNWYKLQGVNALGNGPSGDVGLNAILDNPDALSAEYDLLRGLTSLDNSLVMRANNRTYFSKGVSAFFDTEIEFSGLRNRLTFGLRVHEDEEDRFQHEDSYRLDQGLMVPTDFGAPGSTTNRLTRANAVSAFIRDQVDLGDRLTVTAGLRLENYDILRSDYSTLDPTRRDGPLQIRSESDQVLQPSLSAVFRLDDEIQLIGGIHKGFSPVGATSTGARSEQSWQYELGTRYAGEMVVLEAIGFFNDYSNLLGECTLSSGGDCLPGTAFNGDAVDVYGLELTGEFDAATLLGLDALEVPLTLAYSLTRSEFKTSFDSAFFGAVRAGDSLAYVPEHQLTLGAGLVADRWGVHALLNTISETRDVPGQGSVPATSRIEPRTLVDLSAYVALTDALRLKLKVENLLDEAYLASRRPAGLRPGKPREILMGFDISF